MQCPDVNVLLYAHRPEAPNHVAWRAWMEALVGAAEPFALSTLVAAAFVRITTNPRAYRPATPLPVALAAIEAIASAPSCRIVSPGPRHFQLFVDLCRHANATHKLAADAQHAAVAIEHGCEWITRDSDFAVFEPRLRWRNLIL